jgi:nitrite transporter NirC
MLNKYKNSIVAGMCISLGTFAYLVTLQKTNNPFLSSIMFYIGLSLILLFRFELFTGQVLSLKVYMYTEEHFRLNDISIKEYIITLTRTWIGNLIGSVITTIALFQILHPDVSNIVNTKLSLNPIQMLVGGVFCNLLVTCAVANYKMYQNHLISGFFILCFVICGFNHIVADFSYYTLGFFEGININIIQLLMSLLFVTVGNILGGLLLVFIKKR